MDAFDKDHPPTGGKLYRKTIATEMARWRGQAAVYTQEGRLELEPDFDGYIAIDQAGYPYPIDIEEHSRTYEQI